MKTPEQMQFDFDNLVELSGLDDEPDEDFAELTHKPVAKQEQLNTEGETE